MLVLSRRRDERILIGDDVEIVIVEVRGEKVRIGIKAPSDIAVHRGELRDRGQVQIEPKATCSSKPAMPAAESRQAS